MAHETSALEPRFPHVPAGAGHYESTYLVANHPNEPVAVWIRYTVHKPPGRPASGSIWFTVFEPSGPTAVKVTEGLPVSDDGRLLGVGTAGTVRRDGAEGALSGHGVSASWDLRFEPVAGALHHLPSRWMYRAPIPKTKSTSPYPSMRVNGTVTVSGRVLSLEGWPGMLGHNWGAEHAHRWIWLRGASFVDHPDAWLDVVIGRIKVGPVVLPWIANGALTLDGPDGARQRVGGVGRRATVRERPDGCDLVLSGRAVSLTVHVHAPIATSVGWEYADPSGGRHQVRNCSIAGIDVEVRPARGADGVTSRRLVTAHGGVYELGRADVDPALRMQPYGDG